MKPFFMNKKIISRALFIGRSLLWSLLFYIVTMVAINWDEFSNTKKSGQSWVKQATEKELIPMDVSAEEPNRQVFVVRILKTAVIYVKTAADFLF
jgi:hypothetical protein